MTDTETREPETIDNIQVRQTPFRDKLATVALRPGGGGASPENLEQQLTFAQLMAKDELFLPPHLTHNPATCLAMTDMAQRWGFSPFMVAKNTYVVPADTSRGRPAQLGFMNQLIHAVIERWAPIEHRIKSEYGRLEGNAFVKSLSEPPESRRIRVWTRVRGELENVEYISPPLADIKPKNSPLWHTDPDQQLFYLGTTRLCRRYFPDILLGVYSVDELMDAENHVGFDNAKLVPKLQQRLQDAPRHAVPEGFRDGIVEAGLNEDARRTDEAKLAVAGSPGEAQDAPGAAGGSQLAAEPKKRATGRATGKAKPPRTGKQAEEAPADADGYLVYFAAWLAATEDPEEVETRWKNEWKLRKACGVGGGEAGTQLLRQKDVRVKALSRKELME